MRQLSKKQENEIKQWVDDSLADNWSIFTIDQMDQEQAEKILSLNDHETFWQNADRFINDYLLEKQYGKRNRT